MFKAWTRAPSATIGLNGLYLSFDAGTSTGAGASVCEYSKDGLQCGKSEGKWYIELFSPQFGSAAGFMYALGTDTSKGALLRTGGTGGSWQDARYASQSNDVLGWAFDATLGTATAYM